MHETTADIAFDNRELKRIRANSLNRGMGFDAKLITEAGTLPVVIGYISVEIGCGERVILNNHSDVPPVRRRNSA